MKRILIFLFILISGTAVFGKGKDSAGKEMHVVLDIGTGYQFGLLDLGKRFPSFSVLTAGAYFRTPGKWQIGGEYSPYLGNRVQVNNLYGGMLGPSQVLIDQNGNPALIRYYMRGYYVQGYAGKTIALPKLSKYSGLQVRVGGGFMQHRIKMRFDKGILPQLEGGYTEGYDRLTNGMMITENIQYQYFNTESLCFFAGVNFAQGFTRNQRNWNYSQMSEDQQKRKDFYFGFNLGILIPIAIKSNADQDYYN